MGAVAGVWEQRMLKRGQESWGWKERRGKEGKLRGEENLGTSNLNKLYQSPRKFSCRMKACNFGKFGGSRQSSKKLCIAPRAPAEASQMNLIKRGEKISSDCSLPCPPLEERKKTYQVPFQTLGCGTELRRAAPSHTCITAPCVNQWPYWVKPTVQYDRVAYMYVLLWQTGTSNYAVMELVPLFFTSGHCKSVCLQACHGYGC